MSEYFGGFDEALESDDSSEVTEVTKPTTEQSAPVQPETPAPTYKSEQSNVESQEEVKGAVKPSTFEYDPNQKLDLAEQLAVGVADFIDRGRNREEIKEHMLRNKHKFDEENKNLKGINKLLYEGNAAIHGGITEGFEDIVKTADLIGDTVKQQFIEEDETQNVFSSEYEALEFDLGSAENHTAAGGFAREMISFMTKLYLVPGAGKGVGALQRVGVEGARGAVADMLTDPGSGNLSNALGEMAPGLKNTWVTALSIDEDDNPWEAKLKNTLEGAVIGTAVDGVGEFFGAYRAGRVVLKETGDKAKGTDAFFNYLKEAQGSRQYYGEYSNRVPNLPGRDIKQSVADEAYIRGVPGPERKLDNAQGLDVDADVGGTNDKGAVWSFFRNGNGAIEVSWDAVAREDGGAMNLGKMKTQFQEMVNTGKFRPGEILENNPLSDSFSQSTKDKRVVDKFKAERKELVDKLVENPDESLLAEAQSRYGSERPVLNGGVDWKDLSKEEKDFYLREAAFADKRSRPPGGSPNKRARIYERAGFGKMDGDGTQRAIIFMDPEKGPVLRPIDPDTKRMVKKVRQRPGADVRAAEQAKNGATPDSPPRFNPEERAQRTSSYEPQDVASSQARIEDFDDISQVSANPLLTDAAYQKIASPLGTNTYAKSELKRVIREVGAQIDVDALSKELGQSNEETVAKALLAVQKFIGEADPKKMTGDAFKAFDEVSFVDDAGNKILNRQGVVAVKTLITDTGLQLNDIAQTADDILLNGQTAEAQADMLFNRLQGLLRLHKEASIHYGSGLQAFQIGPIKFGGSPTDYAKKVKDLDDYVTKLRGLVKKGDPDSMAEFRHLVTGLVLSKGDPTRQLGFWANFRKLGGRDALTLMYNSMLSGPLTQIRNIAGSAFAVTMKPMSMAIGFGLDGNFKGVQKSLGAYHAMGETLTESFEIFKQSFKDGPVIEGSKFELHTSETAKSLELLAKSASTPSQKAALGHFQSLHDMINSPWMTLPTRTMSATDDMFKTISARMDLKRESFSDAFGEGMEFNADTYAKLVKAKIGPNGDLIDKKLLADAKEMTFQTELEGNMRAVADMVDSSPIFKYFVPFMKTGHNLMVYAGTHTPVLNRALKESQAIRNGTDEVAKAILKGRVALGYSVMSVGFGMAMSGNMTGNGPSDPQERKIWLQSHQPMSIKVGDRWVSYAALEPFNLLFAAASDLPLMAKAMGERGLERAGGQLAYTIAASLYNRSYFQGLATAVAFLNPTKLSEQGVTKVTSEFVNTFIPYSAARRSLTKVLSPGMYEYRNEFEKTLGSALPGYNNLFATEKVDIFTGEQMNQSMGFPASIINQVLPFNISSKKSNKAIKQLHNLGIDIPIEITEALKGFELAPKDRNQIQQGMYESGLLKNLETLFDQKWFKDDIKSWQEAKNGGGEYRPTIDVKDTRWYQEVAGIFNDSRTYAYNRYQANDEDFKAKYQTFQGEKYRASKGDYGTSGSTREEQTNELSKFYSQ